MNYLNGGYVMIKHNATQKDLAAAYKSNRPVLVYDENQKAHWAQINEKVIETVDEETQETITTYEYSYELLNAIEALVDDSGNPRFIEGDGVPATIEGFTSTYCKWSLSGTHLMLVLAGNAENATTLSGFIVSFALPEYIMNKIYPIFSSEINRLNITLWGDDFSTQASYIQLLKDANEKYLYFNIPSLTLTKKRSFRVQFDLLIDNDYNE